MVVVACRLLRRYTCSPPPHPAGTVSDPRRRSPCLSRCPAVYTRVRSAQKVSQQIWNINYMRFVPVQQNIPQDTGTSRYFLLDRSKSPNWDARCFVDGHGGETTAGVARWTAMTDRSESTRPWQKRPPSSLLSGCALSLLSSLSSLNCPPPHDILLHGSIVWILPKQKHEKKKETKEGKSMISQTEQTRLTMHSYNSTHASCIVHKWKKRRCSSINFFPLDHSSCSSDGTARRIDDSCCQPPVCDRVCHVCAATV